MTIMAVSAISWLSGAMVDIDLVRDYEAYQLDSGEVIVAIISKPIYTASQRNALIEDIVEQVTASGMTQTVYVSMDTDIYISLADVNDDEMARILINTIMQRQYR